MKYNGCRNQLKEKIKSKGWQIEKSNDSNVEIRAKTTNNMIILVYNTGSVSIQGKKHQQDEKDLVEMINEETSITTKEVIDNNKIFIAYGHDELSTSNLRNILYEWGLKPVVIDKEAFAGNTALENVKEYMKECSYGIVLLTPCDKGYAKKDGESFIKNRARQNVVMEMGMLLSTLGNNKVITLKKGDVEFPSDMDGILYLEYKDKIEEIQYKLRTELKTAGFTIKD